MKVNLPVTNQAYSFPKGQTLVSATDTKGRILYCNPAFIEVSGFSKEELLGQPHNIVRHPDMPAETYRDMWQTIAAGKPWSAPVKNRRKNGDFYWVMANATPLLDEQGQPSGYMSVRTEVTPEQIQAADRLYAAMRQQEQAGRCTLVFKEGRLVKKTLAGCLAEMSRIGLPARLLLALLSMMLVGGIVDAMLPQRTWAWRLLGLGVDAALLCTAWAILSRQLVQPLGALVKAASRMAAGDLTQRFATTRDDELGSLQQALGQLSVNLMSIVRDAREQSQQMLGGATDISHGNLDLSQRTESQASSLEQTTASMQEMTGTVRQTAQRAQQAASLSAQAKDVAEQGKQAVNELGRTMQEIQTASSRIGEITQVIEGIAFQTNILALNAAVEAARAGEQGRGFAVVASEVHSLAQRASTAAREIKQLIDESSAKVDEGHRKSVAAQSTILKTVEGVHQVSALVREISTMAAEQLAGISQVNAAVVQLDSITQQNAALVEQMAASTRALEGTASAVTETVQVFRIDAGPSSLARLDAVKLRRSMKRARVHGDELAAESAA